MKDNSQACSQWWRQPVLKARMNENPRAYLLPDHHASWWVAFPLYCITIGYKLPQTPFVLLRLIHNELHETWIFPSRQLHLWSMPAVVAVSISWCWTCIQLK